MKRIYLASSIESTGSAIAKDIEKETGKKVGDLKTVFINTAAEGSFTKDKTWLNDDRNGLIKGGFNLFDYTITGKKEAQLEKDLGACDIIHVNGGNTFYLLLEVRKSGFDKWIKRQILGKNKIYIGSSAGCQVISPDIEILRKPDTVIYEKKLKTYKGIGLVDFIVFPHWGSDKFKDVYFDQRLKLAYKPENKIILLNNFQYIKAKGDNYKIVDVRDK